MITGFDTTSDISQIVGDAVTDGHTMFGRYMAQSWKGTSRAEVDAIHAVGGKLLLYYEANPLNPTYFSRSQTIEDIRIAHTCSLDLRAPRGTGWCFTVDYDAVDLDLNRIVSYFGSLRAQIQSMAPGEPMPYLLGAYGDGAVLEQLTKRGLVEFTVLAGASKWTGSAGFKATVTQSTPTTLYGLSVDLLTADAMPPGVW